MDIDKLPIKCDCGCNETEERNVYREDINGIPTVIEYNLYCNVSVVNT